jgi:tetratricopeptide (TPR) repeat protein
MLSTRIDWPPESKTSDQPASCNGVPLLRMSLMLSVRPPSRTPPRYGRTRPAGRFCLAALVLATLPLSSNQAQIPAIHAEPETASIVDPSELFLKAFTAVQEGTKLEADGNLKGALAKYRFGASMLDQLGQSNPTWQPLIVRYRMRKTTEDIQRLDDKLSVNGNGSDGSEYASPSTADTRRSPAANDEDPLPAADDGAATTVSQMPSSQAAQAQADAMDRATADLRNKLAKTQKDLKTALDQLSTAQKDKQAALRDKSDVEFQLQSARSEVKIAQKRFERTKSDRDDLQAQVDKAESQLKDAVSKNPENNASRKELRNQVAVLKESLAKAQADADAAAKSRDELTHKLAESDAHTADLTKERDAAVAQSDLTKDAAQKIEALQTENSALTQKLSSAENSIAQLTAESLEKKQELDGVRTELSSLKDQLVASRSQNDRSTTAIADLRAQLDEKAKRLDDLKAHGMSTDDVSKMTKENELLRSIVMRQLKDQARRVAAKQLLTEELSRLEVQSDTLNHEVEELGRPTLQLSDEERALFKDPQVSIADNSDPSSMAISIAAVKSKPGDGPQVSTNPSPAPSGANPPATAKNDAGKNGGGGDGPTVETTFRPGVADELVPMAKEAKEDFDRARYTDAENVYTKLLARDPKNPYLLSNMGVVLFREDKLKSAEVVLKKAVAVAPRDAFSQATLGIVYYRMHRYDDAITSLTQAITLDPKNATAHNYLGITSSQKGWPEAAIEEIQKAIALNPNYADAHFNIAVIYATNQPPAKDRAQEHYRIATSLGATPDPMLEKLLRN